MVPTVTAYAKCPKIPFQAQVSVFVGRMVRLSCAVTAFNAFPASIGNHFIAQPLPSFRKVALWHTGQLGQRPLPIHHRLLVAVRAHIRPMVSRTCAALDWLPRHLLVRWLRGLSTFRPCRCSSATSRFPDLAARFEFRFMVQAALSA
jgi:hypothetical protein